MSNTVSQYYCRDHSGKGSEKNREPFKKMAEKLPTNQAGDARHGCPYCAYINGYQQAMLDHSTEGEFQWKKRSIPPLSLTPFPVQK
jgi:hypothetical protein